MVHTTGTPQLKTHNYIKYFYVSKLLKFVIESIICDNSQFFLKLLACFLTCVYKVVYFNA